MKRVVRLKKLGENDWQATANKAGKTVFGFGHSVYEAQKDLTFQLNRVTLTPVEELFKNDPDCKLLFDLVIEKNGVWSIDAKYILHFSGHEIFHMARKLKKIGLVDFEYPPNYKGKSSYGIFIKPLPQLKEGRV